MQIPIIKVENYHFCKSNTAMGSGVLFAFLKLLLKLEFFFWYANEALLSVAHLCIWLNNMKNIEYLQSVRTTYCILLAYGIKLFPAATQGILLKYSFFIRAFVSFQWNFFPPDFVGQVPTGTLNIVIRGLYLMP